MRALADLFPDVQVVLELEPEELGAALLELWDETGKRNDDKCSVDSFLNPIYLIGSDPKYPKQQKSKLELVVSEALGWLENEGLILLDPWQPAEWHRRTRRGSKLKTRIDVEAYRQASLLPRKLLHPIIDQKAWPSFQRGEYDVAVLQAFKAIEVAVRESCKYTNDFFGTDLMRKAFHPSTGPLTDQSVVPAERQALSDIFSGAIGHAKNPQSHRNQPVKMDEAARLLLFASYLMAVVEFRGLLT